MKNCALIIGIDKYLDSAHNLSFSENDAASFHEIAQNRFNIADEDILYYVNDQATYENIKSACQTINSKIDFGDRIIIFCASHGSSLYGSPFFACYDSVWSDDISEGRWFNIGTMFNILLNGKKNSKNGIIAFFDSCQSAISYRIRGETPKETEEHLPCEFVEVFAAAGANQSAYEDLEFQHGCWSYFLFSALNGEQNLAFSPGTNSITSASLQSYLNYAVVKRVKEKNGAEQIPYKWGVAADDTIIIDFGAKRGNNMKIKDIYFGEIDADTEKESIPTELIGKLYYDLGNVEQRILKDHEPISIVAGNKGTGKTFLGEYLANKYNDFVFYCSVDGIKISNIESISFNGPEEKGKYSNAWKLMIYVIMISKIIQSNEEKYPRTKEFLTQIYGEQTQLIISNPIKYRTFVFNKRIKNGIQAPNGYEIFSENGILKTDSLVLAFEEMVNREIKEQKYLLLDGFDNEIRGSLTEKQINQFLDLLHAENEIQKSHRNMKCILLFRQDILNKLMGREANLNKDYTGKKIDLSWTESSNDVLYEFIKKRYESNKYRQGFERIGSFSDIFYGKINGQEKWDWLLELTTYTPRDIVSFFNQCKLCSLDQNEIITEDIMWNATKDYSEYLWREYTDILSGTMLSGLTDDVETFLEKLVQTHMARGIGTNYRFTEANNILMSIDSLKEFDAKEFYEILYESGIICIINSNKELYWNFRENPIKFSSIDISTAQFQIHKGLWKKVNKW